MQRFVGREVRGEGTNPCDSSAGRFYRLRRQKVWDCA